MQLVLAFLDEGTGDILGMAEVDVAAQRRGRAEGETSEFETGAGHGGAELNQLQRISPRVLVALLFEQFQPVADRADRTDQIVTDLARHEGGEIKVVKNHAAGHECAPFESAGDRIFAANIARCALAGSRKSPQMALAVADFR